MANQDELLALQQEVHHSNALKYQGHLITLGENFYVFNRNYQELNNFLGVVKKQETMLHLWDLKNRHQLEITINEILRLLHNFLASAKSLVEQTRVVIRIWYKGDDFLEEYKAQINTRFVNNSLIGFIEDLRNFNLHYSLPITNATLSIKIDQKTGNSITDFSFVLIKTSLIVWTGWTEKGKDFLSKAKEEIVISNLVDDYYKQIFDFHSWLISSLQEKHKKDLLWLAEMRKKIINTMSEEERNDRGLI